MNDNYGSERLLALIVEDDPQLAGIFATAMQVAGFKTETATDGLEALAQLRKIVPDIVLLDAYLPHISGDEILRHIRSSAKLKGTKVVVSTGDSRIASHMRDAANVVLMKPVSFRELVYLAKNLCEKAA